MKRLIGASLLLTPLETRALLICPAPPYEIDRVLSLPITAKPKLISGEEVNDWIV